jgi:hypothetical protein
MKNISNFYRAFNIKDKICLEKNVPIKMRLSFSANLNEIDNITFSKNNNINNTKNLILFVSKWSAKWYFFPRISIWKITDVYGLSLFHDFNHNVRFSIEHNKMKNFKICYYQQRLNKTLIFICVHISLKK